MRRYSTQHNVNTKILRIKVGSKLILNTPKINDKKQESGLEILFSLTHHSAKRYTQNIGKIFIRLINRHFPKFHRLHKIFNRNTVKVSYRCMQRKSKQRAQ